MRFWSYASSLLLFTAGCGPGEGSTDAGSAGVWSDGGDESDGGRGESDAGREVGADGGGRVATRLPMHGFTGSNGTLAMSDTHLYGIGWFTDGAHFGAPAKGLFRVPLAGGEPEHDHLASSEGLGALAVFGAHVYFSSGGLVLSRPLAGGEVETLGDTGQGITDLAANETHVYVAGSNGIFRLPLSGGSPEALTTGASRAIVIDETSVFSLREKEVQRVPLAGGTPVVVHAHDRGRLHGGLIVHDANVYWTFQASSKGQIWKAPTAGGEPTMIFEGEGENVLGLASDSTHLYWTGFQRGPVQPPGWISRIPFAGGEAERLSLTLPNGMALQAILVGAGQIYWTTGTALWTMPK